MAKILFIFLVMIVMVCVASCDMPPNTTFQGRLTDASGNPINGSVNITYRLYKKISGGSPIFEDVYNNVPVNQGLFSNIIGPSILSTGNLIQEDLAEPLYLELRVQQGAFDEVLTPRQRLLGAPYAFTLMPGTIISSSFSNTIQGALGVKAIAAIYNSNPTADTLPALYLDAGSTDNPALRLWGELSSRDDGPGDDLRITSNDDIFVYLSKKFTGTSYFTLSGDPISNKCTFDSSNGSWNCTGGSSSPVQLPDGQHSMYAIHSTEVWFEDFGSAELVNGSALVNIPDDFAATVNLTKDYFIVLTPLGDCNGLYVTARTPASFEVHELNGGTASLQFQYRITAKRAGTKFDQRMPLVPKQEMKTEEGSQ